MPLTPTEIYGILNEKMDYLGYGPGNTPSAIDDSTIENVAALPDSQLSVLFHEINIALVDRWFSNGLNPSSKGLFRFIIRNEGAHGFTITDRFINLIEATPYPQTNADIAADLVGRADNPIEVHKYTDKYKPGRYKGTIDAQAFRKFLTPGGLEQYSAWIETNLFQSAEYGMMKRVAEMMKAAVEGDHVVLSAGVDMNTENGLCEVVENMMTCVDAYRQPTALYNKGERLMSTPDEADVVIVTTPSRWNRVRARLYSDRYHLDQLYISGRVIEAPEGTDLGTVTIDEGLETEHTEEVEFLVTDARGFCLEITTMTVKDFDVANMNYLNAFLHVEGVEGSVPTFCNCVAFTGSYGRFSG